MITLPESCAFLMVLEDLASCDALDTKPEPLIAAWGLTLYKHAAVLTLCTAISNFK